MDTTLRLALMVGRNDTTTMTINYSGVTKTDRAKSKTEYAVRVARIAGARIDHLERRVRRGVYQQSLTVTGTPAQVLGFSMVMDSMEIA